MSAFTRSARRSVPTILFCCALVLVLIGLGQALLALTATRSLGVAADLPVGSAATRGLMLTSRSLTP